jgi:hypothetical protein
LIISSDFKIIFLNESYYLIKIIDMSAIRLVQAAHFIDDQDKLITSGIDGVFIFDVKY